MLRTCFHSDVARYPLHVNQIHRKSAKPLDQRYAYSTNIQIVFQVHIARGVKNPFLCPEGLVDLTCSLSIILCAQNRDAARRRP
jgi:hypothetical protein